MTPVIVQALIHLKSKQEVPEMVGEASEPSLDDPMVGKPISHSQIIAVSKKLKQVLGNVDRNGFDNATSFHLDDLLRGSKVYMEPPKPKAEKVAILLVELWNLADHP